MLSYLTLLKQLFSRPLPSLVFFPEERRHEVMKQGMGYWKSRCNGLRFVLVVGAGLLLGLASGPLPIPSSFASPEGYKLPPTSVVPPDAKPDKKFTLVAKSNPVVVDEGVVFHAMTFNGTVPAPLLIVEEGDVVEIEVRNEDTVAHGLSFHAAYRATSPLVGNIPPGQTRKLLFRASYPGVFMYHCAPGGHGILTHSFGGMYGMVVVEPKREKYMLEKVLGKKPDVTIYLLQHELYASGKDGAEGKPLYVAFNGYNYRYVREPIPARPGDYVRIYYLNVGPSLTATLHLVGIVWDFMYYQGHPGNVMKGGQSSVAGPTDSWVVEFRVPEEGPYLIVTHAFGTQTARGAIGLLSAKGDAPRGISVSSQGPTLPVPKPEETRRVVNPFAPGTPDVDPAVLFRQDDQAVIKMVINSFWPKVTQVYAGAKVTWINEEVFDFLSGEMTGRHDIVAVKGPEQFASPSLGHAEKFAHTFTKEGEYEYFCTIHPYMKGRIRVVKAP